jgi:hypothetical protein
MVQGGYASRQHSAGHLQIVDRFQSALVGGRDDS